MSDIYYRKLNASVACKVFEIGMTKENWAKADKFIEELVK